MFRVAAQSVRQHRGRRSVSSVQWEARCWAEPRWSAAGRCAEVCPRHRLRAAGEASSAAFVERPRTAAAIWRLREWAAGLRPAERVTARFSAAASSAAVRLVEAVRPAEAASVAGVVAEAALQAQRSAPPAASAVQEVAAAAQSASPDAARERQQAADAALAAAAEVPDVAQAEAAAPDVARAEAAEVAAPDVARVAAAVAPDGAAVLRQVAAEPAGPVQQRAAGQPLAALSACHRDRLRRRLALQPAARSGHAMAWL